MRNKFLIIVFILLTMAGLHAQTGDHSVIHIADTLTMQEKANRHTVLLRSELDSLIRQYGPKQQIIIREISKEAGSNNSIYMLAILAAVFLLSVWLLYLFYVHHKKFSKAIAGLKFQSHYSASIYNSTDISKVKLAEKLQSVNG